MAGAPGGGTISAPTHNFIARGLGRNWEMSFLEATSIEQVVDAFRAPQFAGGIVTMPWKKSIIPHLDHVDDVVVELGACNHVLVTENGKIKGTNTDWTGIRDALTGTYTSTAAVPGQRGLVIGAGGASRAAVYALAKLGCKDIYIVNRDVEEVQNLVRDVQHYDPGTRPNVIHVATVQQAQFLTPVQYIVGTVPDYEPETASEIAARNIYAEFLNKKDTSGQGVMLDMCYHPLMTRNLLLAKQHGWIVVDGVQAAGHQLKAQWKLWTGQELDQQLEEAAWKILHASALTDPTVSPRKGNLGGECNIAV
jgi:quinate dehydrogenase